MKGFGIFVKNNLLETKHVENMGEAIWLYLWLLDKMTSINENGIGKVMKNQAVRYEIVQADLGISRQVYQRWVDRLRNAGYIATLRTPRGLCFTINKAEKIFGKRTDNRSIKNNTSQGSDVLETIQQEPSDVLKIIQPMYQNRASNNNNTNKQYKKINKKSFDEFETAMLEFIKFRKAIKHPLTDYGVVLIRKKLQSLYPEDKASQIEVLNRSIENSWRGVFALDSKGEKPKSVVEELMRKQGEIIS